MGEIVPRGDGDDAHLLRYGEAYMKKEEAAYAGEVRACQERQLLRRAKELGFAVAPLTPPNPEEEVSDEPTE